MARFVVFKRISDDREVLVSVDHIVSIIPKYEGSSGTCLVIALDDREHDLVVQPIGAGGGPAPQLRQDEALQAVLSYLVS